MLRYPNVNKKLLEIKDRNFQKHDTRAEAIRIQLIKKKQRQKV